MALLLLLEPEIWLQAPTARCAGGWLWFLFDLVFQKGKRRLQFSSLGYFNGVEVI